MKVYVLPVGCKLPKGASTLETLLNIWPNVSYKALLLRDTFVKCEREKIHSPYFFIPYKHSEVCISEGYSILRMKFPVVLRQSWWIRICPWNLTTICTLFVAPTSHTDESYCIPIGTQHSTGSKSTM